MYPETEPQWSQLHIGGPDWALVELNHRKKS